MPDNNISNGIKYHILLIKRRTTLRISNIEGHFREYDFFIPFQMIIRTRSLFILFIGKLTKVNVNGVCLKHPILSDKTVL